MPTLVRMRVNFVSGILTANMPVGNHTLQSDALVDFPAVDGTIQYAVAIIGAEILYITAHTASSDTATVTRAQESTIETAHFIGDKWEHGPTALDFTKLDNFRVQTDDPGLHALGVTGLWVDTTGGNLNFWIEDGT